MSFLSSSQLSKQSSNSLLSTVERTGIDDPSAPPCTVYLYSRSVLGDEGKGAKGAKHWVLHFDWGYYCATHDANESNGILTPSSHEGPPKAPENLSYDIKEIKRNFRVTPHKVEEKVNENKYSGVVYNLISANCQIWARELARLLGFDLPFGQVEEVVDMGLTAAAVIGACATVATAAMKNKTS